IMKNTPFTTLREELRKAGCEIRCLWHHPIDDDTYIANWLVRTAEGNFSNLMVRDQLEQGYTLFVDTQGNDIAEDVAAILERD
ncbi:hypothetical protein, partial [Alterisphingorhabdus coralli]|uniref:hypothetical protein n=1 Tax=Alterisphingorhabdus coralli TaxID=3071408 RepID=UPI0029370E97